MKICDHDLYDIHAALVLIRFEPSKPYNETVISQMLNVLTLPDEDNLPQLNIIRKKLAEIPDLDKDSWQFVFHCNVYSHSIVLKDEQIYKILISALRTVLEVLKAKNEEQISDILDAVHNLPTMIAENKCTLPKNFWKEFQWYQDKRDKDFLVKEQKEYCRIRPFNPRTLTWGYILQFSLMWSLLYNVFSNVMKGLDKTWWIRIPLYFLIALSLMILLKLILMGCKRIGKRLP